MSADALRAGREAPLFVQTPEWILVAPVSPTAKTLYSLLRAHVNRLRGDELAWPGMDFLAEVLGFRKRHSVLPYLRELAGIGAVDIETKPCALGRRNRYTVHGLPPEGYGGYRDLGDKQCEYRTRKAAEREAREKAAEEAASAQAAGGLAAVAANGSAAGTANGLAATAAQNHTKRTRRRERDEVSTPPREAIADAHPAGERAKITLRFPKNFDTLDHGPAVRCIVRAATAAMKAAGRPLARGVGDRIASQFGNVPRPQDVVEQLAASLTKGLAGEQFPWLFEDHGGRQRVQVTGDTVLLFERYGAIPGAEAQIMNMDDQGYSHHAIANTIAKTARQMELEDEIPDGHYTGDDMDPRMYPDYGQPLPHDHDPTDPWSTP